VAAVKAADMEAQALARAGSRVGLVDDFLIPDALKGFAAVALERGAARSRDDAARLGLRSGHATTRLAASKGLLQLRDILAGTAVYAAPPIVEEQPTIELPLPRFRKHRH
jgi:hypothetical protein